MTAARTATGLDEIKALAGSDLGRTDWRETTQERVDLEEIRGNGVEMRLTFTVEVEGSDKPGCAARAVYRHYA